MLQPVMLRLIDEQLILGEIEQLPNPADQFMIIRNPRQRDGMKLAYLQDDVTTILIPWHQIAYVQLLPGSGIEKVIGFVRE
ncbi:MAG: hypothetical protein JSV68_14350 [Anaerolineaceae bacterium]|jgi:hypothetical protein|nr:hypothetical protein [Chloroflexota bacterium]UCC50280.1 MAG: hypothetical protein JSV68_14350 [Anaerolineaceae bacterium]